MDAREAVHRLIDDYYNSDYEVIDDPDICVPSWFSDHCLTDADRAEGDWVVHDRTGSTPFAFRTGPDDEHVYLVFHVQDQHDDTRRLKLAVDAPTLLVMDKSRGDG